MRKSAVSTVGENVVERFPLPLVKAELLEGIFGGLHDVIRARIEQLQASRDPMKDEYIAFWRHALEALDPEFHRFIQQKYLRKHGGALVSGLQQKHSEKMRQGWVKYIDPINWLESKLRLCWRVGLHESEPLSILDIGPGPGHFAFSARYYGHDVLGLELPEEVNNGAGETYLYDDLCRLYGVERVGYTIAVGQDLPDLGKRFNLISGWMTAFNVHWCSNGTGTKAFEPWSPTDWEWFIAACKERWLLTDGRIVMTLTRGKLSDASWDYLATQASQADSQMRYVDLKP